MNRTIARDVVLALTFLIFVSASLMTFLSAQTMLRNEQDQMERHADEYLSNLAISLELPVWTIDRDNIRNIAEFHMRSENIAYLRILEHPDMSVLFEQTRTRGEDLITRKGPIEHEGIVIGHIELGIQPVSYSKTLGNLIRSTIVTMVVVLLVLASMTGVLLRWFLKRPLTELISGIKRISRGEYDYEFPDYPQEEIRTIIREVDSMATQVKNREQSLKDLNAQLENEVAERKRSETESTHLRNLLRRVIDSMPSALVVVDKEGMVTQWNEQAAEDAGIDFHAALGIPLAEAAPHLAHLMPFVRKAIGTGHPQEALRLRSSEESSARYKDITVYPLESEGKTVEGAVIRVDDVTERTRIEEMMVQTEKMMSVGGLAAGMAHEINNPLGGILQAVQNIERRLAPEMPANAKTAEEHGTTVNAVRGYLEGRGILRMVEGIKDSGSRAARIVQNMLNFSRKSESQMAPYDLNQLLDDTVELASSDYDLKKEYDFRKINIIREYSDTLPHVPCTRTEVEQVVLNLLKNSAQAMAANPLPNRTPQVALRTLHRAGKAIIQIEDNGPGMDENTRKRVFEPFFTTKDPGVGTGLGLSVSYFIITNNHGGEFHVDSVPGRGTTFSIVLPLT